MERNEMSIVDRAVGFAAIRHAGAFRKGTDIPYIAHPLAVMKIVSELTGDEAVRAAAVLHDTVEDAGVTREELEEKFGRRVAELVAAESENKREGEPEEKTWKIRKQETIEHIAVADRDAKIICLGDKLANMRDIAGDFENIGDELWERFNAPDDGRGIAGKKANIGWYYRSIADGLKSELGDTAAWKELDALVGKVFESKEMALKMSAKEFRQRMLAGKEPEEIRAIIDSLKTEIRILKNNAEDYRRHADFGFLPKLSNSDYAVIRHDRMYIAEARKALAKLGCEYIPDDEEKRDEEFQKNIDHIEKLSFSFGGYFGGSTVYTVSLAAAGITVDKQKYPYSVEAPISGQDECRLNKLDTSAEFRRFIKRLHMGEWKETYWENVCDGTQWSVEITYDNGIPNVRFSGSNAFPYNFLHLKKVFPDCR